MAEKQGCTAFKFEGAVANSTEKSMRAAKERTTIAPRGNVQRVSGRCRCKAATSLAAEADHVVATRQH